MSRCRGVGEGAGGRGAETCCTKIVSQGVEGSREGGAFQARDGWGRGEGGRKPVVLGIVLQGQRGIFQQRLCGGRFSCRAT